MEKHEIPDKIWWKVEASKTTKQLAFYSYLLESSIDKGWQE